MGTLLDKLAIYLHQRLERLYEKADKVAEARQFNRAGDLAASGKEAEALSLYVELAHKNDARAATMAGTMYLMGQGTKPSGPKAIQYFEIGRSLGDKEAISMLGMAFAAGMSGVKQDFKRATPLLEKAAGNGDRKAKEMLAAIRAGKVIRR